MTDPAANHGSLRVRPARKRHYSEFARRVCLLGLFLSLGATVGLRAQNETVGSTSLESEFRFAMVGNSAFKERTTIGSMEGDNLGTRDVLSIKAPGGFLLRFGFEFERSDFSTNDRPALPSKLQGISMIIGGDFQLGDAWLVRVEFQPGFYGGSTSLRAKSLDLPIVLGASYFVSSDLQFMAGLSIDQERKYPVLPGLGFRYQISADWVADFVLPTPRLEYNVSKALMLYSGAELQSNSYRVEGGFGNGHGDSRLNGAIVDYDQIRVGVGASWQIRRELTLELEAGFVPIQEFDFHRADIKARSTDVPPYGGVVLKAAF